jgi:RNA polymerase sigma-70 factor, ECF subfamily
LGNADEARDVMQDVFVKILTGGLKHEGPMSGWLNRVTTNECLNRIRDRSRRSELLREHATAQQQADAGPEDRAFVRAILGEVDEQTAGAAICVHIDGMTHEETSKQLGVSVRTVANLLTRFKQRMRELVEPSRPVQEETR